MAELSRMPAFQTRSNRLTFTNFRQTNYETSIISVNLACTIRLSPRTNHQTKRISVANALRQLPKQEVQSSIGHLHMIYTNIKTLCISKDNATRITFPLAWQDRGILVLRMVDNSHGLVEVGNQKRLCKGFILLCRCRFELRSALASESFQTILGRHRNATDGFSNNRRACVRHGLPFFLWLVHACLVNKKSGHRQHGIDWQGLTQTHRPETTVLESFQWKRRWRIWIGNTLSIANLSVCKG